MIPSSFEYHAPTTLAEAQSLLSRYGEDAKLVAGGHSLIPMMKLRLAEPKHLIDLGKISDLSYIREQDGGLVIGAMTTHYQVESSSAVKSKALALAEAARFDCRRTSAQQGHNRWLDSSQRPRGRLARPGSSDRGPGQRSERQWPTHH